MFQKHPFESNMKYKSFSNQKYGVMKKPGKFTKIIGWITELINFLF